MAGRRSVRSWKQGKVVLIHCNQELKIVYYGLTVMEATLEGGLGLILESSVIG